MKQKFPTYEHLAKTRSLLKVAISLLVVCIIGAVYLAMDLHTQYTAQVEKKTPIILEEPEDLDKIENGIHVRTGLIEAEGLMTVVNNCTSCHSAKLITQNRMSADRWNETIKWMQETQGLWELGKNQEIIVHYLVANYPAKKKGRRMILENIEWYELEN